MALNYKSMLSADMLVSDIEKHTEWFGHLIRLAFFSKDTNFEYIDIPNALIDWCVREADMVDLEANTVEQLQRLHEELESVAKQLADKAKSDLTITLEDYNAVEHRLVAYISQLRRLENDVKNVSIGIDPVTGLRSASGMKNDITRELDRRERKGNPFCVCKIEIDDINKLIDHYDRHIVENIYSEVANQLMKSIRSFDDAYHLGKGDFLLVLKHIDLLDTCSVMDRMRDEISRININIEGSFESLNVTASFGVVEPVPGDKIDTIMENSKRALMQAQADGGNQVIQWQEQSALQQYATDVSGFD